MACKISPVAMFSLLTQWWWDSPVSSHVCPANAVGPFMNKGSDRADCSLHHFLIQTTCLPSFVFLWFCISVFLYFCIFCISVFLLFCILNKGSDNLNCSASSSHPDQLPLRVCSFRPHSSGIGGKQTRIPRHNFNKAARQRGAQWAAGGAQRREEVSRLEDG